MNCGFCTRGRVVNHHHPEEAIAAEDVAALDGGYIAVRTGKRLEVQYHGSESTEDRKALRLRLAGFEQGDATSRPNSRSARRSIYESLDMQIQEQDPSALPKALQYSNLAADGSRTLILVHVLVGNFFAAKSTYSGRYPLTRPRAEPGLLYDSVVAMLW